MNDIEDNDGDLLQLCTSLASLVVRVLVRVHGNHQPPYHDHDHGFINWVLLMGLDGWYWVWDGWNKAKSSQVP